MLQEKRQRCSRGTAGKQQQERGKHHPDVKLLQRAKMERKGNFRSGRRAAEGKNSNSSREESTHHANVELF
jgi:hypothetical protein